jgi:hypothetical protein
VLEDDNMPAIALEVQEEMQCVQKMGEGGSKEGKDGQQTLTAEKPHDADPGGIVCLLTHALYLGEAGARVCECVSTLSWPERVKYRRSGVAYNFHLRLPLTGSAHSVLVSDTC